ncbi:serine/threonine-protein kinase [Catenuloplanes nepalensis]|uniref:non-specific serine/threonine protein kinase n=1 Tax=Catenuloplanes nepalensis TaxID=587533 RepID=A0ABT9MLI9_9ACTN|nr:serine/threonine-protein kinase [Catenuloplanes nepalensis]MDP9792287.1 serine/threonine-protein kinase [Catenuloplanes nepalensis]
MPEPAAGTRLNGRYVLDGRIGLGGMSEVWRAADETLGRAVAVKILSGAAAEDQLLRAAIRREARAAARMTHPHAMHVYDYGEFSSDDVVLPFIVMELVEGATLADRLAGGPPLPWRAAARMAAEISAALADAHRLGVVHRDIKPANVMLTPNGAAKVLDFGIATLVAGDTPHASGSFTGQRIGGTEILDGWLAGTPPYAAPELLLRGEAGPPADVYAVGATLYAALTGEPPLAITSWEDAASVHRSGVAAPAPLPAGVPEALAAAALACLSREPETRPPAASIARIFGRYAAGGIPEDRGPAPAGPVSPAPGFDAAAPTSPAGSGSPVSPAAVSGSPIGLPGGPAGSPATFPGSPLAADGSRTGAGPVSPAGAGSWPSPGGGGPRSRGAGGFVPGAAAVPAGFNAPGAPSPPDGPASAGGRSRSDRLRSPRAIGVLATGLIVGGVGLVALATLLLGPDDRRDPASSATGGTTAPATAGPANPAPTPSRPPARSPSPSPSPSDDDEDSAQDAVEAGTVLNRLDAALAQGLVSRDINSRAGSRLFDDLRDLRRDLGDPEALSDGAADLQERLERLADDGDMSPDAASDMIEIVDDLVV